MQVIAFFPFCIAFLSLTIILCIRKLNDFYLRSCIGFVCIAMFLRLAQILIFYVLWDNKQMYDDSAQTLEMKMSVFEYTVPVYIFQTVMLAMLFSAHTMYTTAEGQLFPSRYLPNDSGFSNVDKTKKPLKRKKCFWCL